MIGKWSGMLPRMCVRRAGAGTAAHCVGFECADGDRGSIDIPTAPHVQTMMAFRLFDGIFPSAHGTDRGYNWFIGL
jgi:hypothetical protein